MDIIILIGLFILGFMTAFLGGIAGGGGMLSGIGLILLGLPAQVAVATNKFAAIGYFGSSAAKFHKEGQIEWKYFAPILTVRILGVLLGMKLLLDLDSEIVLKIVGVLLITLVPFLFIKDFGILEKKTSKSKRYVGYVIYFAISVYAGFFGGGSGLLALVAFVPFFGLTFIKSSALNKIASIFAIILSVILFAYLGYINYEYGIPLLFGMSLGGWIGAHAAIKKGNKFVRYIIVIVLILSGIKLLFF